MAWHFNFENALGLAFHEYTLPAKPDSHGCIRLLQRDAKWLYEWGEAAADCVPDGVTGEGTTVPDSRQLQIRCSTAVAFRRLVEDAGPTLRSVTRPLDFEEPARVRVPCLIDMSPKEDSMHRSPICSATHSVETQLQSFSAAQRIAL